MKMLPRFPPSVLDKLPMGIILICFVEYYLLYLDNLLFLSTDHSCPLAPACMERCTEKLENGKHPGQTWKSCQTQLQELPSILLQHWPHGQLCRGQGGNLLTEGYRWRPGNPLLMTGSRGRSWSEMQGTKPSGNKASMGKTVMVVMVGSGEEVRKLGVNIGRFLLYKCFTKLTCCLVAIIGTG